MLTFLLLGQAPTSDAILKKFDQFMSGAKTISVSIKAKVNGKALGNGTIRVDKPHRFNLSVATPTGIETITFNETSVLEVNQGTKFYREPRFLGQVYPAPLKITGSLSYSTPLSFIRGNSRGMFPKDSKVTPKVVVNGVTTDMISNKTESMGGSMEIRANFDAQGKLIRYFSKSISPQGTLQIEQDFANYVVNQKIPDSAFSTKKPLGYSPFSLDSADYGLQQGEALPNINLTSTGGQTTSTKFLISGKNTLIVVTDPEFHANSELFKSIQTISKRIPDFKLVTVSARRDVATAKKFGANTYFDPTGQQLPKLLLPGSPAMYLVDKKGTIAQMFFGFDGQWTGLDKAIERLK